MKNLTILLLFISSALFGQVNLKYINVADSLEIREQGTSLQFFQFDAINGITFPDGTTQLTAGAAGRTITAERANVDTISANNNTKILFTDPIVVDTVISNNPFLLDANSSAAIDAEGGLNVFASTIGIFSESSNININSANILSTTATSTYQTSTVNNYLISGNDTIRHFNDTLYMDDNEGSTAVNIKLKNLYATDNVEADSGIFNTSTINTNINIDNTGSGFGISFSDEDTRIIENSDDDLRILTGGVTRIGFNNNGITIYDDLNPNELGTLSIGNLNPLNSINSYSQTLNGTTVTSIIPPDSAMENTLVDKLQFNPTTQAYSDGTVFYDTNEKALTFYNNISDFKEELGRGVNVIFYNNTGSTIPNGTIVRSTGARVNGSITFYADLAGNSSLDSLQGVAMTTVETLDESFGIATLVGQVNGLNTSAYSDNDILYISHEGTYTNVNPVPPLWSVIIGRIQYADADSGSIYFFPAGDAGYTPAPTFSASFSRESEGIANGGIDVFSNITNATNDLFTETNNAGFTFQGDSLSPLQDGIYTLSFSYSFQGDAAQNDDWRVGIFKNGVEAYSTLRTSSLTNKGGVPFEATNSATSGDWFSFKIANTTSASRTSTFIDGVISVTFND